MKIGNTTKSTEFIYTQIINKMYSSIAYNFIICCLVHVINGEKITIYSTQNIWNMSGYCNTVSLNNKTGTWNWKSCSNKTTHSFCQLSTELIKLHKVRELRIQVTLKIQKTVRKKNVIYLKINRYKDSTNDPMYIGRIDEKHKPTKALIQSHLYSAPDLYDYNSISIEFQDIIEGFCGEIVSVTFTYIYCSPSRNLNIMFPKQTAPTEYNEPLRIHGNCKENAKAIGAIYQLCFANGTTKVYGECLSRCTPPQNSMMEFPVSETPLKLKQPLKIEGKCIKNAQSKQDIYQYCFSNGSTTNHGECLCNKGFEKQSNKCNSCPLKFFKDTIGNEKCKACGKHSHSDTAGISCYCKPNYFRESGNHSSVSPCFDAKPKNLGFKMIAKDKVLITWNASRHKLSIGNITFSVHCTNCNQRRKETFSTKHTQEHFMTITNLIPHKVYLISITASYQDKHKNNINIHTIHGSFLATGYDDIIDHTFIIVLSIMIPIVFTCAIGIAMLYIKQKQKTIYFKEKVKSLTRKSRPPIPPSTNDQDAEATTPSDISPYAVLNFKPSQMPLMHDHEDSNFNNAPQSSMAEDDCDNAGYMTMQASFPKLDQKSFNDFPMQAIPNVDTILSNEADDFFLRSRTRSCLLLEPKVKSSNILQQQDNVFQPRLRSRSCYIKEQNGYNQSILERTRAIKDSEQDLWTKGQYISKQLNYNEYILDTSLKDCTFIPKPQTRSCYITDTNKYKQDTLQQTTIEKPVHEPKVQYEQINIQNNYNEYVSQSNLKENNFVPRSRTRSCYITDPNSYNESILERTNRINAIERQAKVRSAYHENDNTDSYYTNVLTMQEQCRLQHEDKKVDNLDKRNKIRSCYLQEPTDYNIFNIFPQGKLRTKYQRAESKEFLNAADYVKLRRPHSADDVNIVYGIA